MSPLEEMHTASVNRSIRTIKAELEYLCDASVISPQTLSDLLSRVPEQTPLHAPLSVGAVPSANSQIGALQPPSSQRNGLGVGARTNGTTDEKDSLAYRQQPTTAQPPPPSYNAPPPKPDEPTLCHATARFAYTSTDAGDLELQPNDQITVTEYTNTDWWKGRNVRTDRKGIFPSSYVLKVEDKGAQASTSNNYGNQPLEVSGMGNGDGKTPGKGGEMASKFGKKLGNAAIFGAGATIGGNIVNSIF